ncbi:MAG: isocitrate lyase/PEP mutase family protein [Methyloligellaceae bacterium]
MSTQKIKANRFKELHERDSCFVIPNPWDTGSTKILEQYGFEALATTSAGVAFSLGLRDGQSDTTREDILNNARQIVENTSLPVSADLENGYSNNPEVIARTIKLAADTGLVGGSIEDRTMDNSNPIRDLEHATECIRAAVEAKNALPFHFTLTARAENYLFGIQDLDDTIRRLQAFQEAGADVLYAPGLTTREQISAVISSVDLPVNVVMGLSGNTLTKAELEELGVTRISLGSALARAAYGAFLDAIDEIKDQGTFTFAEKAAPFSKLNDFFA